MLKDMPICNVLFNKLGCLIYKGLEKTHSIVMWQRTGWRKWLFYFWKIGKVMFKLHCKISMNPSKTKNNWQ